MANTPSGRKKRRNDESQEELTQSSKKTKVNKRKPSDVCTSNIPDYPNTTPTLNQNTTQEWGSFTEKITGLTYHGTTHNQFTGSHINGPVTFNTVLPVHAQHAQDKYLQHKSSNNPESKVTADIPEILLQAIHAFNHARTRLAHLHLDKEFEHISIKFQTEHNLFGGYVENIFKGKSYYVQLLELMRKPAARKFRNTHNVNPDIENDDGSIRIIKKIKKYLHKFCKNLPEPTGIGAKMPNINVRSVSKVVNNALNRSPKKNLRHSRSKNDQELSDLLKSITKRNKKLSEICRSKIDQSTELVKSRAPPFPNHSGNTPQWNQQVRSASVTLYSSLSNYICNCHEFYLNLQTSTKSPPKNNTQSLVQYSVLITEKITATPSAGQHMQLDISKTVMKSSLKSSPVIKRCTADLHDAISNHSLQGFIVCHGNSDTIVNSGIRRTLKEFLDDQDSKLTLADKLSLGLKLGYAALHFHASPWIKSWSMKKVAIFTSSGDQKNPSYVMPHIIRETTGDNSNAKVCDLFLLGRMLLDIVGCDSKQFQRVVDIDGNLMTEQNWKLLATLNMQVGIPYRDLVHGLLQIGLLANESANEEQMEFLFKSVQELETFISSAFYDKYDW